MHNREHSRSVHPSHPAATDVFSYNEKILDILCLQHEIQVCTIESSSSCVWNTFIALRGEGSRGFLENNMTFHKNNDYTIAYGPHGILHVSLADTIMAIF